MAATASSGLIVTRTHRPKILRTLQRHAWPKPTRGFMAYWLGSGSAAFLSIDRLTGFLRVFIDRLLYFARLVDLLSQRIKHRLRRWRWFLRGATCNEQDRQRHCQTFNVTHCAPSVAGHSRPRVSNT